MQEASRREEVWKQGRHERPGSRSRHHVPTQLLPAFDGGDQHHHPHTGALAVLGRDFQGVVLPVLGIPVCAVATHNVAHQLSGPHVWHEAIR